MVLNRESYEQRVARELREAGLKATPQRLAIVRALAGDESHPTAQALYDRLRRTEPGLSFATVYNTLAKLSEIGRVQPLTVDGSATRFDPNVAPHDHAVCDGCGAVRDVPRRRGDPPRRRIDGFEAHRVERIYRGLCAACREAG